MREGLKPYGLRGRPPHPPHTDGPPGDLSSVSVSLGEDRDVVVTHRVRRLWVAVRVVPDASSARARGACSLFSRFGLVAIVSPGRPWSVCLAPRRCATLCRAPPAREAQSQSKNRKLLHRDTRPSFRGSRGDAESWCDRRTTAAHTHFSLSVWVSKGYPRLDLCSPLDLPVGTLPPVAPRVPSPSIWSGPLAPLFL